MPTLSSILGVDVGFAQVKLAYPEADITISVPSAVAEPQEAMAGFDSGQKVFVLDNGTFAYGKDALEAGSKQIQSLDDSWLIKYMPGLICAAAAEANVDLRYVDVLSTGLPIVTWRTHKEILQEKLKTIHCNGETYKFERVDVRPQGVGALGYHASCGAPAAENGLIIDIGGNTVLAVRYENLKPKATNTRQYNEMGVLSVARSLTPFLSSLSGGCKVTEIKAMQAVRGRKYRGHDIGTQVDSAVKLYSERLLANLRADYKDVIPELDCLVVAGGGAYMVGEALKQEYPGTIVLTEPEYANVRGYVWLSEKQ